MKDGRICHEEGGCLWHREWWIKRTNANAWASKGEACMSSAKQGEHSMQQSHAADTWQRWCLGGSTNFMTFAEMLERGSRETTYKGCC